MRHLVLADEDQPGEVIRLAIDAIGRARTVAVEQFSADMRLKVVLAA